MASRKIPPSPRPTNRGASSAATIGFAYGTFDLLHEGHLFFLRCARLQCDELIVAIDSDRFARERKGWGRPVEDEAMRSHSVAATGLVHLVIAVDNPSQLADAIDYYQPDLLITGDDGRGRGNKEGDRPRIVLVPMLPGFSTTAAIKERLQ